MKNRLERPRLDLIITVIVGILMVQACGLTRWGSRNPEKWTDASSIGGVSLFLHLHLVPDVSCIGYSSHKYPLSNHSLSNHHHHHPSIRTPTAVLPTHLTWLHLTPKPHHRFRWEPPLCSRTWPPRALWQHRAPFLRETGCCRAWELHQSAHPHGRYLGQLSLLSLLCSDVPWIP